MSDQDLATLLPQVVAIAREAAAVVMRIYNSEQLNVQIKQDNSPVTAADLAANDSIIRGLHRLTPTIPIVSEESLIPDAERLASSEIWLVDPVDGTKEFIKHNGQFTVNIALIRDGTPALGVVAVPAQDMLFYGAADCGAWRQIGTEAPLQLHVQPNRSQPIVAVSGSHPSTITDQWMQLHGLTRTQALGSSLKICYIADHTIDVYPRFTPMFEWDIAAGDAVLRAAGGSLTVYPSGEPMAYNKPSLATPFYIAGNGLPDQAAYRTQSMHEANS